MPPPATLRRSVLAVALATACPALAADLPVRTAPPPLPVPAAFTWTGFYLGVNAGYGFDAGRRGTDPVFAPGVGVLQASRRREGGLVAGGQAGYLQQFTPGAGWVAGIEADGQHVGRDRRRGVPTVAGVRRDGGGVLATLRGRLGYAFDRLLVYGTTGLAIGDLERGGSAHGLTNGFAAVPGGPPVLARRRGRTETGLAAGGGVEYALTDDVSVRVEGLYANLDEGNANLDEGKRRAATVFVPGTATPVTLRRRGEDGDVAIVRGGLNYRF